ncbi:hypothetical protein ON010_g11734 [Phytophthora cinnamomi]|nr:hypothetical protein ON010_g11734 [Phytophthora cinnamomi]
MEHEVGNELELSVGGQTKTRRVNTMAGRPGMPGFEGHRVGSVRAGRNGVRAEMEHQIVSRPDMVTIGCTFNHPHVRSVKRLATARLLDARGPAAMTILDTTATCAEEKRKVLVAGGGYGVLATQQGSVVRTAEKIRGVSDSHKGLHIVNLALRYGNSLGDGVENEFEVFLARAPWSKFIFVNHPSPQDRCHGLSQGDLGVRTIRTNITSDVDVVVDPVVVEETSGLKAVYRCPMDGRDGTSNNTIRDRGTEPAKRCRRIDDQRIVGLEPPAEEVCVGAPCANVPEG